MVFDSDFIEAVAALSAEHDVDIYVGSTAADGTFDELMVSPEGIIIGDGTDETEEETDTDETEAPAPVDAADDFDADEINS